MEFSNSDWKPGDRAYWMYEPRGGYGFTDAVNAVIRKVGPKRVAVEVAKIIRYPEHRVVRMLKVVKPEKLRRRDKPCAELGEE